MKQSVVGMVCGIIFALGLGISGMTQPHKVVGFLNFFGNWDPSLLFVMVGAIFTYAIAYRIILKKRQRPLCQDSFQIPTSNQIDGPLIVGSLVFGMGWGLAGYCPGPALTSLTSLQPIVFYFVASMLLGMGIYRYFCSF